MGDIEKLSYYLNLSSFQSDALRRGADKYDFGRLVVRGGVLYAPRRARGVFGRVWQCLFGRCADLIGAEQFLAQDSRDVCLYRDGYYCGRVCAYKYRGDKNGDIIAPDVFRRKIRAN